MKITLNELESKWIRLRCLLEDSEGELTEEIELFFDELKNDITNNSDKYAYVMKRLKSEIEIAKGNKDILFKSFCESHDRKAKQYKNNLDKLSSRIIKIMDDIGLKEIQGEQFRLLLVNSKDSLEVINYSQEQLEKFKVLYPNLIKTEYSFDKEELKKAIEKDTLPIEIVADVIKNKYLRIY